MNTEQEYTFCDRHIGPSQNEQAQMLQALNVNSLDDLIHKTVPNKIREALPNDVPDYMEELTFQNYMTEMFNQNKITDCYIGLGYHPCVTPPVIKRNVFENPGWYTQYTPYQAEISQGRLEILFYFQTMVCELTSLEIANASLLDEATAAAEAMTMCFRARKNKSANTFFISESCLPQTIQVIQTKAEPLGITIIIGNNADIANQTTLFGALIQYPNANGQIDEVDSWTQALKEKDIQIVAAVDLFSLTLLKPPGEWGADIVVGSSQRFGVPMGYGGPHAGFIATTKEYQRLLPGRLIGLSKDKHNNPAYRMALQTREQHIRREKATSNICTAQALLAIMSALYAIYHGPKNLKKMATRIHNYTQQLDQTLQSLGYHQKNTVFFDTLLIVCPTEKEAILKACDLRGITLRTDIKDCLGISINETTSINNLDALTQLFSEAKDQKRALQFTDTKSPIPTHLQRTSHYLTQPIFNQYHTETQLMRFLKTLENKDLSLTQSMIPLGSCTMKLNAAIEMGFISNTKLADLHPFSPLSHAKGYQDMFQDLEKLLCQITGFDSCSLQPNSGAQGEYAGLLMIRAYHKDRGEGQRNVMLIPSSAHGTNPASASLVDFKVVIVKCNGSGNIDSDDLKSKVLQYQNELAGLMVTYPSTHGVFEETIQDICTLIHDNGGQVYMDGANMNAQVGLTNPFKIGADCCHLNLHKTFSIPHGGGGPGIGPICVAKHLSPYLPTHHHHLSSDKGIGPVSAAPWGSASILSISYAYIRLLGRSGMTQASKIAILNANYIKSRLEPYFTILYTGKNNFVAHELIVDIRPFRKPTGVEVEDIAKRLMDYSFHAPTMSWPVPHTLMIEPTESECKDELDRFCDAMIDIYHDLKSIETGNKTNNVLKNAPHTVSEISQDQWSYPYSRTKAAFPLPTLYQRKVWPAVGRIDNAYGDRNLICTCSVDDYTDILEPIEAT